MATSKEFKEYVCERLGVLDGITCHPMMGEFLLYHDGLLFGGIYDGRVLVKRTETNKQFGMREEIPYKGAKPMYFLEDLENSDLVKSVLLATCEGLKTKKK